MRFTIQSFLSLSVLCGGMLLSSAPLTAGEKLTPIFDGKTLDGWVQKGGKAKYHVEDGQVVGTSTTGTPNSFMTTKKHYKNFILELEFLPSPVLNSGVQIRSNHYDEPKTYTWKDDKGEEKSKVVPAGRVHGYQVEIDPSDRAWSGGIYDESRRGWLNNLEENEPARKAFKKGEWNHYRIVADGDSIKTWINGVPAADLKDGLTSTGFIGLQVHNYKEDGHEIRWRNIRLKELP